MTIQLAHASHWLANLLYLAPVAVLGGGIAWQRAADRKLRNSAEEDAADDEAS